MSGPTKKDLRRRKRKSLELARERAFQRMLESDPPIHDKDVEKDKKIIKRSKRYREYLKERLR